MRIAISVSGGRVSAALDYARHLVVIEYGEGKEVRRSEMSLEEELPLHRARRIEAAGIGVLICGAISRLLAARLANSGVDIIAFVSGSVEEVLAGYFAGELESGRFLMPGSTSQERTEWRRRRLPPFPITLTSGRP